MVKVSRTSMMLTSVVVTKVAYNESCTLVSATFIIYPTSSITLKSGIFLGNCVCITFDYLYFQTIFITVGSTLD